MTNICVPHGTILSMLVHPQIDPILFQLGPIAERWYGLMYLLGFVLFLLLGQYRAKRSNGFIQADQVSDLLFYAVLGVVLGGRMGSVLFYNFDYFLRDPLYLLRIWEGGMSFHGGLLGVLLAVYLYQRKQAWGFFRTTDFIAPLVPLGLGAGRIGNFINGELWGRVSDVPWAMVFPQVDQLARHPSQLYQCLLEGPLLFAILWLASKKERPTGVISGLFLVFYGLFRFITEFVREPDRHIGFIAFDWMSMGQLLSLPMIALGLLLIGFGYSRQSSR